MNLHSPSLTILEHLLKPVDLAAEVGLSSVAAAEALVMPEVDGQITRMLA